MLFAPLMITSSCALEPYAKPQIRCEGGRNKGNGNEKSDCWAYGEIGVVINEDTFK